MTVQPTEVRRSQQRMPADIINGFEASHTQTKVSMVLQPLEMWASAMLVAHCFASWTPTMSGFPRSSRFKSKS